MSVVCRICLESVEDASEYHGRCLRALFGAPRLPAVDVELAKLHTAGLAMVGRTSLSGVQKKVSLGLSSDRATLQVALPEGRYILKPQSPTYPALPENEHLTTRLATLVGIETAPHGLVRLSDGTTAFVALRFDRTVDGRKLRQEDFCQLAGLAAKQKYEGTAELCVRIVRQYAAEPLIELLKLFRQLVFAWWSGNGDLHLKNLSLTIDSTGRPRLSPAYDLVCTRLLLPDDPLALPVLGQREGLTRGTWQTFAELCRLPSRAWQRVLQQQIAALEPALERVAAADLPAEMRTHFAALLRERTAALRE